MSWIPELFDWLHRQLFVMDDQPYYGTDFTDDQELQIPKGEDWDEDLGKSHFFSISMSIMIFFTYVCYEIKSMCLQMLAKIYLQVFH